MKSFKNFFFKRNPCILEEQVDILDLRRLNPKNISKDMEKIEAQFFPSGYSQPAYDIEDDFKQQGFFGVGIFERQDNSIKGYLYGFSAIEQLEEIAELDLNAIKLYDPEISIEDIKNELTPQNTFYVSNYVITGYSNQNNPDKGEKQYRGYGAILVPKFLQGIKNHGFKYLIFDALKDTQNLFLDGAGNIKTGMLNRYGLSLVATELSGYESLLTLMKFK